jgi:hypothetical protein
MFRSAEEGNALLTWIRRGVGTVVILTGWGLLPNPMKVLADVIPLLGDVVGFGTGLVALRLTPVTAPAVIGVAWLVHRRLVGLAVLTLSAAGIFGLSRLRRRGRMAKPA